MEPNYLDFWFPFLLIFARLVAFVAILPLFSWRGIPILLRVFFALLVSVLLAFFAGLAQTVRSWFLSFVLITGKKLQIKPSQLLHRSTTYHARFPRSISHPP
jgi:flagellar biosynthetic protein FliR